jgi:uncharacterized protein YjbI with pentapeptide repeats
VGLFFALYLLMYSIFTLGMTEAVTYQLEILETPFVFEQRQCDKTVVIKTFNQNKLVSKKRYGYVTKEEVYEQLKNGNEINLTRCYIKDFSIAEYKRQIDFEELSYIEIRNFKAENTFFDCDLRTDFSYTNFLEGVNFNDAVFSHGNVSFFQCKFLEGNVDFKRTHFGNGEISFQYADFGNKDVTFSSAVFYGGVVSFVNAIFNDGQVNFKSVNFNNCKVKFHYAKFGIGDISFQKTKFGNQTFDCRRIEFGTGKIDFRRAVFGDGYITFDESEIISGKFNFRSARFGNNDMSFYMMNFGDGDVLFENVNFGTGHVTFAETISKHLSFKGSRLNIYLNLRVKESNSIDLSDTVLRDIIDLKPVNHAVNINILYLNGMRNLGRIIIDWNKNKVKQLIKNQTNTTLKQKAEQFNLLKEDFHLNGQYEDEDEAYIQFKRFEQRADVKGALEEGGLELIKLPYYIFRWLVFDKMGLYATNPLRVLFSMIVIYIGFSFTFFTLHFLHLGDIVNSVGAIDTLHYIQISFYHSAITFLTIGYGDYYPTAYSRGLSIIEGWTGLFLMSYFTVAFVRKILR